MLLCIILLIALGIMAMTAQESIGRSLMTLACVVVLMCGIYYTAMYFGLRVIGKIHLLYGDE